MRALLPLCVIAALPLSVLAQTKEPGPVKIVELNRKEPVSYDKDIEPIFYKRCIACHSGSIKEGKLDLASYEGLIKGGKRGSSVKPGKSAESFLYQALARTQKPFMPPRGEEPVTPEELALVKLWIDQGAKAPTGVRIKPKIIVGTPPPMVHPVRAVAVSPDKAGIAAGRGNQIHIYDAGTGQHIRTLIDPDLKTVDGKPVKAAHLSIVESMVYSPDSKYLVTGSFQEVNIWDAQTGVLRQKLTGFAHNVVALTFSADGKMLATGGGAPTEDGEVKIFEVGTWKQIMEVKAGHSDTVYGVSFAPDGKKIATCSADKFIKVWEIPSAKFLKSFEGHTHHVLDVGWTSDGKLLASAGGDNTVKVWDWEKGEQVRTINAHAKQVTRLLFIGKTTNFVTCGGDALVKVFTTAGGTQRTYSGGSDFVYAISISPDGAVLAAGGEDGVVRVYNGNTAGGTPRSLLPPGADTKKN